MARSRYNLPPLFSRPGDPSGARPGSLLAASPRPSRWVQISLAVAFVGYWLFAHALERVDLMPFMRQYWDLLLPMFPLPNFLVFLLEMFHWRVLRHLLPVVLGWVLAQRAAVGLVHVLYDMPTSAAAGDFLRRLQAGGQLSCDPIDVSVLKLDTERRKSVLLRVGGPGAVKIASGEVAVTELNGRFQRVLGSGKHSLLRFETIRAMLDLRPQERTVTAVPLVTKDGLPLKADVHLVFRISTGREPATPAKPYPYDEEAVRSAAYAQTIGADNRVQGWDTLPERLAQGILIQLIRGYRLDELKHLPAEETERMQTVRQNLERELRRILLDRGIDLQSVAISPLELPDPVTQQYEQNWKIEWEMQRALQEADGKAAALEEMELARAEAEITMVQAIVEGVQRARQEGRPAEISEIMALRLIEALEQMAHQSQSVYGTTLPLLPQLQAMRQQIVPRPIISTRTEE